MLLAGAMTVSLTACGGTADGTQTAAGSEEPHTVAVILKTLNSEYWKCVAAGVEQAAADLGCEVQLQGPPSETSYDEQINEIETTLTAGEAEALVLAPPAARGGGKRGGARRDPRARCGHDLLV